MLLPSPAHPQQIDYNLTYEDRLKLDSVTPNPSNHFDLRLSFFDMQTGGNSLGQVEVQAVTVDSNGLFTVQLHSVDTWNSSAEVQWVELGAHRFGGTSS